MPQLIYVLLAAYVLAVAPVQARMYQWLERDSGIVRLAGDPPPWYRNGDPGPRVFVFENGRLIDDTAIALPPEQEDALREEAFREVDLQREEAAVRKLERTALRKARLQQRRDAAPQERPDSAAAQEAAPEQSQNEETSGRELDAETVRRMKQLIREWDKQQEGMPGKP